MLKFCVAVTSLFCTTLLSGIVLRDAWCWFVTPLGVAEIGLAHAIGLEVLLSLAVLQTPKPDSRSPMPTDKLVVHLLDGLGIRLVFWAAAWIAHTAMVAR